MATFANLWLFLIADPCSKLSTQETKSLRAHSIKSTRSQFLFSPGKNEIRLSYTHRANSWQSWQGRGPARERRRWCGTGWRTSWGADNRAIFPASRHRSTPRGLLWRGWLARDPVSKPETITWESAVVNMIFFFFSCYLVSLTQTVDSPHLALLIGIWQDAHGRFFAGDGEHKVLATLLSDVFPQLSQQPRSPLLFHFHFFSL